MKFKLIIGFFILNCLLNSVIGTSETPEEAAARKAEEAKQAIAAPGGDSNFVKGQFYDDGSYSAMNGKDNCLKFFTRVVFTATYIYIKGSRTYQSSETCGILGSTLLVTGDTKKFFLPYVFFESAKPTISGEGNLKFCFDVKVSKDFLKNLFPGKKPITFRICLLEKLEKENINFIIEGIEARVKGNHLKYNSIVANLKGFFNQIYVDMTFISKKELKLRVAKKAGLSGLWIAKANIIRTSLSTSLASKLDEFEMNYSEEVVIKEFFCENYVVNDAAFYYKLVMKTGKTEVKKDGKQVFRL